MTPAFALEIDPILAHALDLLERMDSQDTIDAAREQGRLRDFIAQAEARLGQSTEWRLAKYALVSWTDEMLIAANWQGADWWKNNTLEFDLFGTRERAYNFYRLAEEAKQPNVRRDALEVYYLCVLLGFRGLYKNPLAASDHIEAGNLPPRIEDWVSATARSIQAVKPAPLEMATTLGGSAPPLTGQSMMLASFLSAAVLGAVVLVATLLMTATPH